VGGGVLAQAAGGDALEAAGDPGQCDPGRIVHKQVYLVGLTLNFRSSAPKSVQTFRVTSSQLGRMVLLKTFRRHFAVETKCVWRV